MFPVPELHHIWHYQAPTAYDHPPRIIPEGRQDVEIFIAGRGFFEHEGRLVTVTPGTILWHQAGEQTIYKADRSDPYACIVVAFEQENRRPVPRVNQWKDRPTLPAFIEQILTEFHGPDPDMRKLACYAYGQLLWQCQIALESSPAGNIGQAGMKRVADWIEDHFAEKVDLQQLAEIAGMSIPHLHSLFKKFAAQSPYQYIQARRLQEAKILLASTRFSVKEIAVKAGFRDIGNFCRTFKQHNGVSAQAYRLEHMDKR